MNTKICYLYRDAGNYKVHNECVIQGELSKEQIQSILDCCDMGEYFIPRQVGMPERRFDEYDTEVDHCWFEISEDGFERTNQPANIPLTPRQLVENFALRKDNWDDTECRINARSDKLLGKKAMALVDFFGNLTANIGQVEKVIFVHYKKAAVLQDRHGMTHAGL